MGWGGGELGGRGRGNGWHGRMGTGICEWVVIRVGGGGCIAGEGW